MPRSSWIVLALATLYTLAVEMFMGFGLWFAPGWANGWPGGLSFHVVWSAGMAGIVFLLVVTAAVAMGAVFVASSDRTEANRRAFVIWLIIAAIAGLLASWWIYGVCHAMTLRMFPNGYNPVPVAIPPAPAPPAVGN